MSIEDKFIEFIDSNEEDKSNEASPSDASNQAQSRILEERQKLEALIVEHRLSEEDANILRISFEKDLQEIHDSVVRGWLSLGVHDIGLDITSEAVSQILELFPEVSVREILQLFLIDHEIDIDHIIRLKQGFPEIGFETIQDFVITKILYTTLSVHRAFPNESMQKVIQFVNVHESGNNLWEIHYIQGLYPNMTLSEIGAIYEVSIQDPDFYRWPKIKELFPNVTIENFIGIVQSIRDPQLYRWDDLKSYFPDLELEDIRMILFNSIGLNDILEIVKNNPGISFDSVIQRLGEENTRSHERRSFDNAFPEVSERDRLLFFAGAKNLYLYRVDRLQNIFPELDFERLQEISGELGGRGNLSGWYKFAVQFPEATLDQIVALEKGNSFNFWNEGYKNITSYTLFQTLLPIFHEIIPNLSPDALFDDPALNIFTQILEGNYLPDISYDDQIMVARNMYFKGIRTLVNEDMVNQEYRLLMAAREEYSNVPIFAGRNIVFAAHQEDLSEGIVRGYSHEDDTERFGKQVTLDAIREQGGNLPEAYLFHPENTQESLNAAKDGVLQRLIITPSPMTFVFDGHGSDDGVYFSDGEYVDGNEEGVNTSITSVFISYEEIAQALIRRHELLGFRQRDMLLFSACSNQSYIRNIYAILQDYNRGKVGEARLIFPILIGQSEFGQLGFSSWESQYGNDFFGKVLNLSEEGTTTIGTIMEKEGELRNHETRPTNPSVFIPTDDGESVMQIVQIDGDENDIQQA